MHQNKIQDIVVDYVNSLSKEDLDRYNLDPKYDVENDASFGLSEYALEHKYSSARKILSITRNAVCTNQGQLVQFMFLAAEKHKALRILMQDPQSHDVTTVKEKLVELRDYIDNNLKKNIERNVDYIHQYFDGRSDTKPRICLKGKSLNQIARIFLDKSILYKSNVDVDKSSAYKYIKDNGRYYIQNDIPGAVKKGQYENSRLDINKVKQYLSKGIELDDVWSKCWENVAVIDQDNSSFYKSTLIIPVTLLNNTLEKEFVYKFNSKIDKEVGESTINPNEIERTIFAFLCIDHVNKWFFEEENDVRIGFMIADLISFYLFLRVMYVEISDIFSSASQYLKDHGIDVSTGKLVYSPTEEKLPLECSNEADEYGTTIHNLIASISGLMIANS